MYKTPHTNWCPIVRAMISLNKLPNIIFHKHFWLLYIVMSTLVSMTLIPSPIHTHTHTCSLMYWMQSLPVFSWSTTMASMLRPSTLVIATVYLRGGLGHENMHKQKQTNKQSKVDMNHLPPVDWFTQVNQTAILNMKTNETNQYTYT